MNRLLIVSNRLPISVRRRRGSFYFQPSIGGLATGLRSIYKSYNGIWIGWAGITLDKEDERKEVETKLVSESSYPVFLSQRDVNEFYYGFCNKTIWPLFHYFPQYALYSMKKVYGNLIDG